MDFPIKNGDFPWQNVSSPEGNPHREKSSDGCSETARFLTEFRTQVFSPRKMHRLTTENATTLPFGSVSKPCSPVVHIKIAGLKWM